MEEFLLKPEEKMFLDPNQYFGLLNGRTLAELTSDEKNSVSARYLASVDLREKLAKLENDKKTLAKKINTLLLCLNCKLKLELLIRVLVCSNLCYNINVIGGNYGIWTLSITQNIQKRNKLD